jgi:beta-fructofuranosidase
MSHPSRLPAILQAVMQGQPRALADSHYPRWHHAPVTGLMNDPNGFLNLPDVITCFISGTRSPVIISSSAGGTGALPILHWQHEPIALMPDEEYDRNGCYSGSAWIEGTLTLCYTGNVKFDDGSRTAWQCLATENADGTFTKLGPVLPLPEGYTGHVRDPKVWQHEGRWYMVLGAQDLQKRGKVLLFSSAICMNGESGRNRRLWHQWSGRRGLYVGVPGPVCPRRPACPDLLPAGVPAKRALSQHLSGGVDERRFRLPPRGVQHGELHELDAGFEFYAPQTMQASDGRRLLVGWMGVPDGEEMLQPTLATAGSIR